MNTFLPYPEFKESAKCLDFRRLCKQRIECLQILNCLKIGPIQYICHIHNSKWMDHYPTCGCNSSNFQSRKTPWYFHPAVQMWKGYEIALIQYGWYISQEWINRGYKDNCKFKILNHCGEKDIIKDCILPPWLGNEKFHLAMKSNLIRKKPEHYRSIFGSDIPDNLPYVWKID